MKVKDWVRDRESHFLDRGTDQSQVLDVGSALPGLDVALRSF